MFGVVSWWLQPSVEQCSARTANSKWRLKDPGVALWWWRNREVQQGPARVSRDTPQNLTRHTSHVTRHTSHVTPHTSHLTPHTSHLTPHTSHNPHPPPAPPSPPHKRRVRMARASPSGPRCRSCTPPLPSSSASRPLGHVDRLQRARLPAAASAYAQCVCKQAAQVQRQRHALHCNTRVNSDPGCVHFLLSSSGEGGTRPRETRREDRQDGWDAACS